MRASPLPRAPFSGLATIDNRKALTLILGGAFLWSLLQVQWTEGIFHSGGFGAIGEIIAAAATPELAGGVLGKALAETWRTVAFAVAGLTVALIIGFPLGLVASGVLARSRRFQTINIGWARFVLAFFRSIHELVWAWLFVAAFGLSPMSAVLAIGIPYGGILGRVYAELLQDVPEAPLKALRNAGASEWRVFLYGRLPMAFSDILSYTFYRLECGIRAAAIMGFIGLGGLGQQIHLSLQDLAYGRAWTFLAFLILLVVLVDVWSTVVRRRAVV